MQSQIMQYALKDGVLVNISDVERGLKCGCYCPSCGVALEAHKGTKKVHHFKHHSSEDCGYGYETSLHMLAKKIISEEKKFIIPKVVSKFTSEDHLIDKPAAEIKVDHVELENRIDDIVPDITLYSGNKILIVEIFVTHRVDDNKLEKIKRLRTSTIEIDLSKINRSISENELKQILLNDCDEKKWVFNDYIDKWHNRLLKISKKHSIIKHGLALHTDYCPRKVRIWHGKPYANLIDDCIYCKYHLINDDCYNQYDETVAIYCFGDKNIESLDDIKNILLQTKN